ESGHSYAIVHWPHDRRIVLVVCDELLAGAVTVAIGNQYDDTRIAVSVHSIRNDHAPVVNLQRISYHYVRGRLHQVIQVRQVAVLPQEAERREVAKAVGRADDLLGIVNAVALSEIIIARQSS